MIEKIEWAGKIFALIIRSNYELEGADFITPTSNSLQIGILKHKQGMNIKPHIHNNFPRTINETQEVLHIVRGKVEAEFYDNAARKIGSTILDSGDTILLLSGGHGFKFLEDTKMIEVKQGPYANTEKDKIPLEVSE